MELDFETQVWAQQESKAPADLIVLHNALLTAAVIHQSTLYGDQVNERLPALSAPDPSNDRATRRVRD